jgi:glycerophosphoryl diester phosphodiesterase
LHGGDDGELNHHFEGTDKYIFDATLEELQSYDLAGNEKIPTLEELLHLTQNKIFLNLEVKAPHNPSIKANYNYRLCIEKVYDLIIKY